jgi:signal transduction histidine kinase
MQYRKYIHWIVFAISSLMQGLSIFQYHWKNTESYSFNWLGQYYAVATLSILLTLAIFIIPKNTYRSIFFLVRFVLVMIVYLPSSLYIGMKLFFLIALFLDISFFLTFPGNLIASVSAFLAVYAASLGSRLTAQKIPLPLFHDLLFISMVSLSAIAFFTVFKYFYDAFLDSEERLERINQTIVKLTDANSGFQHYIRIVGEKSSEDERNRIIREIHDSIGYTLTTTMMLAASALETEEPTLSPLLKETLNNIHAHARSGLNDMRIVLRILKNKKKREPDLIKLKKIVSTFEKATNIKIRLVYGNAPNNFGEELANLVFRLIQEGMINSLRHGMATRIDIFLTVDKGSLIITINDDGKGFKDIVPGIGLKGIRERVRTFNGEFSITSSGSGATLRIVIPMNQTVRVPDEGVNEYEETEGT